MKKLLVLAGAVVFLAAACNQSQSLPNEQGNTQRPTTAAGKVDAAVNKLNANIDSETAVYEQTDIDVVNSDSAVINGFNGVSNASKY